MCCFNKEKLFQKQNSLKADSMANPDKSPSHPNHCMVLDVIWAGPAVQSVTWRITSTDRDTEAPALYFPRATQTEELQQPDPLQHGSVPPSVGWAHGSCAPKAPPSAGLRGGLTALPAGRGGSGARWLPAAQAGLGPRCCRRCRTAMSGSWRAARRAAARARSGGRSGTAAPTMASMATAGEAPGPPAGRPCPGLGRSQLPGFFLFFFPSFLPDEILSLP